MKLNVNEIDGFKQIISDTVCGVVTETYPIKNVDKNSAHDKKYKFVFAFKMQDSIQKAASSTAMFVRPSDIIVYAYDDHARRLSRILAANVRTNL
jgi:hypothetical protein